MIIYIFVAVSLGCQLSTQSKLYLPTKNNTIFGNLCPYRLRMSVRLFDYSCVCLFVPSLRENYWMDSNGVFPVQKLTAQLKNWDMLYYDWLKQVEVQHKSHLLMSVKSVLKVIHNRYCTLSSTDPKLGVNFADVLHMFASSEDS